MTIPSPFALPEIIYRVGMFIPIWFPRKVLDRQSDYDFKPKDLLAAMHVNRTFHDTLKPLLWIVYNESALEPRLYKDPHNNGFMVVTPPPRNGISRLTVNKNCRHIRYLELIQEGVPAFMFKQPTMFDFKDCTNLRELRLSVYVDPYWVSQVIRANPNLRVLEWAYPELRPFEQCRSSRSRDLRGSEDLEYVSTLRNLQGLSLLGWVLFPLHLCQVLNFNANTLEELDLTSETCVIQDQETPTDARWLVPKYPVTPSRKIGASGEEEYEFAGPLSLPKLKTLNLDLDWDRTTHHSVCGLVRSMPALEHLNINPSQHMDPGRLGRNLRASCPRLKSIESEGRQYKNSRKADQQRMAGLIGGCASGHMVTFKMGLTWLDPYTVGALLAHGESLQELDLTFYGRQESKSDAMMFSSNLFGRCPRLKRVSLTWQGKQLDRTHGSMLLAIPWHCTELEKLTLRGFEATPIGDTNRPLRDFPVLQMFNAQFKDREPGFLYSKEFLEMFGWVYAAKYSSPGWAADPVFRLLVVMVLCGMNGLTKMKFIQLNGETYLRPALWM
ncbi:hypothetical protein BGW39_006197 [Mortierella sp. 14UC]|nr:hypothetical protein BGW39_006197 [Mortierella sp. 14UC]